MCDANEYSVDLYDTIADVDRDAWRPLCPADSDIFMKPELLQATENSMTDAKCWYVLVRNAERKPAAAAVISSYALDAAVMAVGFGAKVAKAVGKIVPPLTRLKLLYLGTPFCSGQSHVRIAPDADRESVVRQLDEVMTRKARETKAEIIVAKEFQDEELPWTSLLERFGYRRADSMPMNYVPVDCSSFEEYLRTRKSKKRADLRRTRKRMTQGRLERVVCRGEDAARRYDARAQQLYENVLFKSQTRSEYLPAEFFREIARQLPDNAEFVYYYAGDRLLAFACCLFAEGTYIPLYAGIDYECNREYDLYLNILYECVDRGLQFAPRHIWLGANADDIKHAKLNTFQEPRHLYVKGAWWLTRFALRLSFGLFFPEHPLRYPKLEDETRGASHRKPGGRTDPANTILRL